GPADSRLRGLAAVEPAPAALRRLDCMARIWAFAGGVRRDCLGAAKEAARLPARALASHPDLRDRIPGGVPLLRLDTRARSRSLPLLAAREDACGPRLSRQLFTQPLYAPRRSLVCRWLHQLLLLRPVPYRHPHQADRDRADDGIQPRHPTALRADFQRRV